MGAGIVELLEMETRDRHKYFGTSGDGDTRWTQVLWSFLKCRHEMGPRILEFVEIEARDGRRYFGVS
jgi:hypothetical protein